MSSRNKRNIQSGTTDWIFRLLMDLEEEIWCEYKGGHPSGGGGGDVCVCARVRVCMCLNVVPHVGVLVRR